MGFAFPPNAGLTHTLMCLQLHNRFWMPVKQAESSFNLQPLSLLWAFDAVVLCVWLSENQTLWPCGMEGTLLLAHPGLWIPCNSTNVQPSAPGGSERMPRAQRIQGSEPKVSLDKDKETLAPCPSHGDWCLWFISFLSTLWKEKCSIGTSPGCVQSAWDLCSLQIICTKELKSLKVPLEMTVPEEADPGVQDWTCTFWEKKNQNQKSAGSGGVVSLPRKREGKKWDDIAAEWRAQRSQLPSAAQPGAPLANRSNLRTAQGARQCARGEMARLLLLREHRKWQPFGTWWRVHPTREVCAFLESMNNQGKR